MILAIDFDETVHDRQHPKPGMKMGPPIEGAVEALKALKAAGNMIIIHTVWGRDRWDAIAKWLDYYGIPYDDVTNIKPNAKWFIDDRAIGFRGDWSRILEEIYGT